MHPSIKLVRMNKNSNKFGSIYRFALFVLPYFNSQAKESKLQKSTWFYCCIFSKRCIFGREFPGWLDAMLVDDQLV